MDAKKQKTNPTIGSLFAGIGGFDLGFENAGFVTKWQVEIEPVCRAVLADRFPHAQQFVDVRECGAANLEKVDVITAGFPCQDISICGKGAGITGERSGLWKQAARIIGEVRPRYVLLENSPMLTRRGLGVVLGDLADIGFDAEWGVFQGSDVSCPAQGGKRIFILATPNNRRAAMRRDRELPANAQIGGSWGDHRGGAQEPCGRKWWEQQPRPFGVADGVAHRVDRIKATGNGWVPVLAARAFQTLASRIAA